jgi:hypothetical protein
MKKLLMLMMASIMCMQSVHAEDTANIKIKINGALKDNRYFLCLPNIGCLSILAATKGKVFPIFHPIEMNGIFVTDVNSKFRVTAQGLPQSCDVTVAPAHTITISGKIIPGPNNSTRINQLHCSLS